MIIKFGDNRSLGEWYMRTWTRWSRDDVGIPAHGIDIRGSSGSLYSVSFYGGIYFDIQDLYSGPQFFLSLEEAKQYVDEFLVRISKLRMFW
jgi:hypothetical protein